MQKTAVIGLLVLAFAGTLGAAWAGVRGLGSWLLLENERYALREVLVESSGRFQSAHVMAYGDLAEGMNLFAIDLGSLRKTLEEVPLIREVEIQRLLPDRLHVRIRERLPVARISTGSGSFTLTVDSDGFILGRAAPQSALPMIVGYQDRGLTPGSQLLDAVARDALQLAELCASTRLSQVIRISQIHVGNPDYLDLRLESGLRVLLPRNVSKARLEETAQILLSGHAPAHLLDMTVERNIPGV